MSNNRNLGNIATAITNATSGQVLTSQGSGVATFADAGGTGVTVHNNQAAMLTDAASASEGSLHYETANNKLYVKQSSGFFLLASITNTAPTVSGFTETTGSGSATTIADNGTFALTSGSNTVITLTATDPDLETLVYSATVTSGTASNIISSPSLPISNQSGNTFTLTPVASGAGGTVTIRFDVSDGNNVVNKTHSFSIVFTVVDSNHTTLLATATGTSDNNNITDSSTANSGSGHSITVTGDAHAGTFSPYRSGGYSTYFGNGGSERITVEGTKSTLAGANADFSISAWIYPTAGNDKWIYGTNNASHNQAGWHDLYLEGSTKLVWRHSDGPTNRSMMSTNPVSLNEWSYVLINRTSSVTYMYINGSLVAQNSDMTNALYTHTNAPSIGIRYFYDTSSTNLDFEGYITDVHVKTAAISSPTTVPTERAVADSDTWLLTAHLPYFADGSSNNYTVGAYNNITIKPFSPYDYKEYSAADHGGSVYFDTSDDYLTVPNGSWKTYGSSNFTIECWFYADRDGMLWGDSSTSGFGDNCTVIAELKEFNGANAWVQVEFRVGSTKYGINPAQGTFKRNAWNHIAFVRNGNTFTVYSNGKDVGNTSQSGSMNTSSNNWAIASGWPSTTGSQFNGYISDFRVSKSARYTAEFTPPTAPLSSTNAELHIKGTDASIIDKSQNGHIKIINNTTGSSTNKGGNWANTYSIYFDGAQDGLVMPINQTIGTGDFTIEAFVKLVTYGSETNFGIFQSHTSSTVSYESSYTNSVGFYLTSSDNNPRALCGTSYDGASTYGTGYAPLSYYENNWRHIAVAREGTNLRIYVEGNLVRTHTNSNSISATYLGVGALYNDTNSFKGNISDGRLTVGLARYTASDETSNIPSAPLKG